MLEAGILIGVVALLGGAFYLRQTMPWPFKYEGSEYRRMPDGSFQDAGRAKVIDTALIPHLHRAYEAAKYGEKDLSDLPSGE